MKPTKIAFVSCAYGTYRKSQPAWAQIRAAKPDLLLMLGDNAYMSWSGTEWDFDALERCYREQFEIQAFREVIAAVPTLAIWDDHDCGPDDTLGAEVPAQDLARTREKFDRWMSFARNDNRPQMYCSWDELPDVRVLMLDVRTWRTSSQAAHPTLLGHEQEQWLWRQLDPQSTAQKRYTIVASGTGFSVGRSGHRVADYSAFAQRLASTLQFRPGGGTDPGRRALFLGGDVHYNKFVSHPTGFHEAISSGVACYQPETYEVAQFTPDRETDNWGLITIGDAGVDVVFHANARTKGNPRPRAIDDGSWVARKVAV